MLQTQHEPSVARRQAATTAMMSSDNPDDMVRPGCIVVYDAETKGSGSTLGIVIDRVGKKKSVFTVKPAAAAAAGSSGTVAVALRQVRYIVPGGNTYKEADLVSFASDTQADSSVLQDAWEMLLEEGTPLDTQYLTTSYWTVDVARP